MKAIMYGAGAIGRGYMGAIFSMSGYEVTFIDILDPLIEDINRERAYDICFLTPVSREEHHITNMRAIHGRESELVAEAICAADIMATAVGANSLPDIVDNILLGVKLRMERGLGPLNIILCENLMDGNTVFEGLIRKKLTGAEWAVVRPMVGIVEASISITVPVQTPEMLRGQPLRLCMERHLPLLVDADGFRGDLPPIQNMLCFSPFDPYIRRKLYIHNMGHACCAYLGMIEGIKYIHETLDISEIRVICQSAMMQVATALSRKYGMDSVQLLNYCTDLLVRFENSAIFASCERVGSDPRRKLQSSDRLIGAALLCLDQGVIPSAVCVGAAAALYQYIEVNKLEHRPEAAQKILLSLIGKKAMGKLSKYILPLHQMLDQHAPLISVRRASESLYMKAVFGTII